MENAYILWFIAGIVLFLFGTLVSSTMTIDKETDCYDRNHNKINKVTCTEKTSYLIPQEKTMYRGVYGFLFNDYIQYFLLGVLMFGIALLELIGGMLQ